ncbi:MAG: prephenate dehydratase [Solirubrobacteraceae bacterium]|nr:prephenate dehydratase [Solirubrobacteraceae bacterium]
MRVGHLGPAGTYSEEAALRRAGAEPVAFPTLPDTIAAVAGGDVELAAVPIENSLEGSIGVTLDTLAARDDVTITGELVLPIIANLIAREALDPADVAHVVSHPQPLAQCAGYLRRRLPQAIAVPASSTAEAVRQVMREGPGWAALGPQRAADLYGAVVVEENVADDPSNATRFVWVARAHEGVPTVGEDAGAIGGGVPMRTSLVFWGQGDREPGWLVRCLSEFAFRGVNLSKIESRPLRSRIGHYRFFVDCDDGLGSPPVREAVTGLRTHCTDVRVLGSYPRERQVD